MCDFSVCIQVQRIELEKKHLELMIESMKKQHEEEIKLLDESYKYSLSFLVYKVPFSFSS